MDKTENSREKIGKEKPIILSNPDENIKKKYTEKTKAKRLMSIE